MNTGRLAMIPAILATGSLALALRAGPAMDRDEVEPAPDAAPQAPVKAPRAPTPLTAEETARARTLVGNLGSRAFAERESACRELLALGEKSPGEILALLPAESADPEIATRCESLREALTGPDEAENPSTAAAPGARLGAPNRGPAPAVQPRGGGVQIRPGGAIAPAALNLQTFRIRVQDGEVRPEPAPEPAEEKESGKDVKKGNPERKTPAPAQGLE